MASLHHFQSRNIAQPGIMPYHPVQLDITALIGETVAQFDNKALQKDIIISTNFIRPEYVMADRHTVRLILRKLISNAIRYTPNGGTILITENRQDLQQEIRISDSGTGMTPEQLWCLSEPTYQDSNSIHGLDLCKELVTLNKGTIWADSMPGFGTDVGFSLPLS